MAEGKLIDRFKNAWDAFKDPAPDIQTNEISYSRRPDVRRLNRSSERSIVATIWNQIAIDVSQVSILHVRTDENGMYTATEDSALNRCLTDSANLDQTGRALIQDAVLSMFDEGCVAIVPVVTDYNPRKTRSYDIEELRTGKLFSGIRDTYRSNYTTNEPVYDRLLHCRSRWWPLLKTPLFGDEYA